MNCRDAKPFLDQLCRPGEGTPQLNALREHVALCDSCRQAVESLGKWEEPLAQAMNRVPVPAGLNQRLLSALSDAAQSTSSPAVKGWNRWSRRLVRLTAICLVICGLGWGWSLIQQPKLSRSDVAGLLQVSSEELPPAVNPFDNLPRHWSSLRGRLYMDLGKRLDLKHLRLSVTVIPIEVRYRRGLSAEGTLLVIPKSRWNSPCSPSIAQSTVQYAPPYVWTAWTERDVVYILGLEGPAPLLEQVQRQLGGSNAIL